MLGIYQTYTLSLSRVTIVSIAQKEVLFEIGNRAEMQTKMPSVISSCCLFRQGLSIYLLSFIVLYILLKYCLYFNGFLCFISCGRQYIKPFLHQSTNPSTWHPGSRLTKIANYDVLFFDWHCTMENL